MSVKLRGGVGQSARVDMPIETRKSIQQMAGAIRHWRMNDLRRAMQRASKAAAMPVADEIRKYAPEDTGRLRRSIKPAGSLTNPKVKVGTVKRVWYARPVAHTRRVAWPIREIVESSIELVVPIYLREQKKVARKFNQAVERKARVDV